MTAIAVVLTIIWGVVTVIREGQGADGKFVFIKIDGGYSVGWEGAKWAYENNGVMFIPATHNGEPVTRTHGTINIDNAVAVVIPSSIEFLPLRTFEGTQFGAHKRAYVLGQTAKPAGFENWWGQYFFRDFDYHLELNVSWGAVMHDGMVFEMTGGKWTLCAVDGSQVPKNVTIPAYINGAPVTNISNYAFGNVKIHSVEIADGVESIGVAAFLGCTVRTMTVPLSVISIGAQGLAIPNCTIYMVAPEPQPAWHADFATTGANPQKPTIVWGN